MKYMPSLRPLWIFLFPVVSCLQGAPENIIGGVSSVSLTLKATTIVEGTVAKDPLTGKALPKTHPDAGPSYDNTWVVNKKGKKVEEVTELVSKQVISKYSNKELLTDLVAMKVIPEIKGWSLVKVEATVQAEPEMQPHDLFNEVAGPTRFYLIKNGVNPVGLDNIMGSVLNFQTSPYMKVVGKKVTKFDDKEDPKSTAITYAATFKSMASLYLYLIKPTENEEEEPIENGKILILTGLYNGGEKFSTFGPTKKPVLLSTSGKIGPVFGMSLNADELMEEITQDVLEGSISFGNAAAKDLSLYPRVTEPVQAPGEDA